MNEWWARCEVVVSMMLLMVITIVGLFVAAFRVFPPFLHLVTSESRTKAWWFEDTYIHFVDTLRFYGWLASEGRYIVSNQFLVQVLCWWCASYSFFVLCLRPWRRMEYYFRDFEGTWKMTWMDAFFNYVCPSLGCLLSAAMYGGVPKEDAIYQRCLSSRSFSFLTNLLFVVIFTISSAPIQDLRQALSKGTLGELNSVPWAVMSGNCLVRIYSIWRW